MQPSLDPTWLPYDVYRGHAAHTVSGNVVVLPQLYSPQLDNARDLLVYLPPAYAADGPAYPVLYMQDGQNLFDAATAFLGQEWGVDETLDALAEEGLRAIVVGLPNIGEERLREYNPFEAHYGGCGERYLAFIVETVKPLIDRTFRTYHGRESTGLAGSSLGGLISLYGLFRYPDVFSRAGCLSPALWFARGAIHDYVLRRPYVSGRIYLDSGTRERVGVRRMVGELVGKGYHPGLDLLYVREEGGEHNEAAWARRLPNALRFLLGA
jgi:predicted alpha/beta superfamily hydrolase